MARRRVVVGKGSALPGSPFLTHIGLKEDKVLAGVHPFTLPLLEEPLDIGISTPVTFLVFNFASYLEEVGSTFEAYGGKSLHDQSHGEAFLSLFSHNFEDGLFILDEPEAALSPQRQLAFLRILHDLGERKVAQFVIATHSPILLTLPGSRVLSLDDGKIREVDYRETEHFRLTRDFLNPPERFFRHLLEEEPGDDQ